ncbi:MAG: VRR-NUC domain-containing protein [Rubrobacter sp.]|nr:VRR-NUC domain-containing protein [Rubrobacter sp.]
MRTNISERDFERQVLDLAKLTGWKAYHTFDSRRSAKGFPDLVLARPPVVVFAELKNEVGKLRTEQREWLAALGCCERIESRLWRPGDFEDIQAMLCERERGA